MSRLSPADIHTGYHSIVTDIPYSKQALSYGLVFAGGCDHSCQYESRLWRVALIYGLVVEEPEAKAMQQQRAIVCADG